MSKASQVYQATTGINFSGEVDMRQEFISLLNGTTSEIAKAEHGLLRRMKLQNNKPVLCPCVDRVTKEPDRDYFCPVCMGERYLWTETFIDFYRVMSNGFNTLQSKEVGNIGLDNSVFYVKHDTDINIEDKIIRINLDTEGNVQYPIKRVDIFQLTEIVEFRLDRGRIEYKKLFSRKQDVKYKGIPK